MTTFNWGRAGDADFATRELSTAQSGTAQSSTEEQQQQKQAHMSRLALTSLTTFTGHMRAVAIQNRDTVAVDDGTNVNIVEIPIWKTQATIQEFLEPAAAAADRTSTRQEFKCDLQVIRYSLTWSLDKVDANGKALHGW